MIGKFDLPTQSQPQSIIDEAKDLLGTEFGGRDSSWIKDINIDELSNLLKHISSLIRNYRSVASESQEAGQIITDLEASIEGRLYKLRERVVRSGIAKSKQVVGFRQKSASERNLDRVKFADEEVNVEIKILNQKFLKAYKELNLLIPTNTGTPISPMQFGMLRHVAVFLTAVMILFGGASEVQAAQSVAPIDITGSFGELENQEGEVAYPEYLFNPSLLVELPEKSPDFVVTPSPSSPLPKDALFLIYENDGNYRVLLNFGKNSANDRFGNKTFEPIYSVGRIGKYVAISIYTLSLNGYSYDDNRNVEYIILDGETLFPGLDVLALDQEIQGDNYRKLEILRGKRQFVTIDEYDGKEIINTPVLTLDDWVPSSAHNTEDRIQVINNKVFVIKGSEDWRYEELENAKVVSTDHLNVKYLFISFDSLKSNGVRLTMSLDIDAGSYYLSDDSLSRMVLTPEQQAYLESNE